MNKNCQICGQSTWAAWMAIGSIPVVENLGTTTLSITTFSITTFSITTFSITTFSVMIDKTRY